MHSISVDLIDEDSLNGVMALDPTFDGDGKVTTDFQYFGNDFGYSLATAANGDMIVLASTDDGLMFARYLANGSLDTAWAIAASCRLTTRFT